MIDTGEIPGPRIFPWGPPISQTAGHFHYRPLQAVPSNPGDPLDDLDLVPDPGQHFDLIMKDGIVYKNTLE